MKLGMSIALGLLLSTGRPASGQDIWNLNLAPSPGGRVETVVQVPGLDSFELRPGGLFHVYTWYWVEWFQQSAGTCSSASSVGCTFTLPATYTTIDVPIEDATGHLGELVQIPVTEPSWRVTFTAVPDPGYYFVGWGSPACADNWPIGGGKMMSCRPEYPLDADLAPLFSQCPPGASCVTVKASPGNIGSVRLHLGDASAPASFTCDTLCTFEVPPSSNWVLTGLTSNGAVLSEWEGCDSTPADGSCTLTVTGERRVGARFKFPLVVTNTSDFVFVWLDLGRKYLGTCDSGNSPCTYLLDPGAQVGFTRRVNPPAMANYRYTQSWQGCAPRVYPGATGETTTFCDVTMSGPRAVQSVYSDEWHFHVARPEHGRIVSSPPGIDCGPTASQCDAWFPVYSTPTFTATPDPGYTFFGWNDGRVGFPGGDCVGAGSNPVCSVYLNHEPRLTGASFYPQLMVQISGGGGIQPTVSSASPFDTGTSCPATPPNICVAVAPGSTVSLAPTSFPGFVFAGWGGACTGTGACSPQIVAPSTVTASFTGTHKLLVSTGAFGVVGLSSTPFRTRCNYGCDASDPSLGGSSVEYSTGTTVNLVAVSGTVAAYPNYVFTGWGGVCSGKSAACTLNMGTEIVDPDGFTRVQATFTYGSNVQTRVEGQGRITSDVPGVNCTGSCFQYIAVGALTTLTATPSPGWIFAGWSGGACSGTGTCAPNILYDAPFGPGNAPIVATFVPANADLVSLTLSPGVLSPSFDSAIVDYLADVRTGYSSLTIVPTVSDLSSTLQARVNGGPYAPIASGVSSGALPLNVGANVVEILVTARDGLTTRTYTVTVTRSAVLAPGDADPGFTFPLASSVWTVAQQPDGKLLISGGFWGVPPIPDYLARLNPDGVLDAGFNAGLNNSALSVAVQGDGKILIGGFFTRVGGSIRNGVARLNPDGTLDLNFDPDANNAVRSFLILPDGRIVIAGQFTAVGGVPRNRVARLNSDGSLDPDFHPDVNNMVSRAVLQADGKILLVGSFSSIDGTPRSGIARLNADGTLDAGFNPAPNNAVAGLAPLPDGKVLVTGFFSTIAGAPRPRLARLNADGTIDAAFDALAAGSPISVAVQADGKILLAGGGMSFGGVARANVARLNADGALDAAFDPDTSPFVRSLALQSDGKVLIVGDFNRVAGVSRHRVARLENDAVTGSLAVQGSDRILWIRGGAAPETMAATFELSTDGGLSYTPLGAGTRIAAGFELTGLSLPPNGRIRARARTVSIGEGASSGLAESLADFGAGAPEIAVFGNGVNIASGHASPGFPDHTDFGSVAVSAGSLTRTYTIANVGAADLMIANVSVVGAQASDFAVTALPVSPVAGSGSTTFDITFDPAAVGTRSAIVSITSNDNDENPFEFAIQGTGLFVCPTIALPQALPNGVIGSAYAGLFTASGGSGTYSYALTSGAAPQGLTLAGDGLSGTLLAVGVFTFEITATDTSAPGTCSGARSYTVVIGSAISPGDLVIREFRTRGPAGAEDEFIEIANRSAAPLTIAATDGSAGFGIASHSLGLLSAIPNGTVIPVGGFYLAANSTPGTGYSLAGYGGPGEATADAWWTADLPDHTGIGLFRSADTFNTTTRVDAVGFAGGSSPFLEGAGIPVSTPTGSSEVTYSREAPSGSIQDTGNNATDFVFGDTNAGTFGTRKARLASPGPQNLASQRDSGVSFSLPDPAKPATAFPNRWRVSTTATTGVYYFRWKVTNLTGAPISSLRIRVTRLTTLNAPGYAPGGTQADFRLVTSADSAAFTTPGEGSVIAKGLVLEAPPTGLPLQGGFNASASVPLPGGTLAAGGSVFINVAMKYEQAGAYAYWISGEARP